MEHLRTLKMDVLQKMHERREVLRHDLHGYGALSVEPDFQPIVTFLEQKLNDPTLVEFFRKGGGLRNEFRTIIEKIKNPESLHYLQNLKSLREIVDPIFASTELYNILNQAGKSKIIKGIKVRSRGNKRKAYPALRERWRSCEKLIDLKVSPFSLFFYSKYGNYRLFLLSIRISRIKSMYVDPKPCFLSSNR